ncbi:hypothetical protein DNTS_017744, partial [Danionella cerebrum]
MAELVTLIDEAIILPIEWRKGGTGKLHSLQRCSVLSQDPQFEGCPVDTAWPESFIITGFDALQNQKLLGVLILISYMFILLGNGINLCIISSDRRLHKPMYILICNLAVVDVMYSSTCCTTMISVMLVEIKTVSYYSCISRTFFYNVGDLTECLALTLMALDRVIAIRIPLRYHSIVTNSRIVWLVFFTWLISFAAVGYLIYVADNLPYCQPVIKYVFCSYSSLVRASCVTDPDSYFNITTIYSLAPLCGLFPFIICTYAVLAYSVAKLSSNSSRKQMFNTCSSHLIVLLSFYIPKLVYILLTRIGVVLTLTERNAILIGSVTIPCMINPTVYCTRTKEIRKRLLDVIYQKKVAPNIVLVLKMGYDNFSVKHVESFIIVGFDSLQNQKLLGVLILISYMFILLGNAINLCIISSDRRLHKPMYILICNLAVVDVMYSSTCCTTMISVLLAEINTVSYYSCISRTFFYHLGDLTECMALTLMAIDRLIAIRLPLRYHSIISNSQTFWLIFLSWLIGIAVVGYVISVADSLVYCQPVIGYVFCSFASMVRFSCVNPEPYFNIGTIFSLFPLCGLLPFILCTYAVLAYSVAKLSNNSSRKQMINTCLSHLIVLLCFYIPKFVYILLTRIGLVLTLAERNAFTIIASVIPPLINPTVYCSRTKEIRKRFIIAGFDSMPNQKLLGVLILISYMFILLGNAINLCIISTDRRLHKPMYILICNLAVVDVMYSSACCTTMISVLLADIKTVSYFSCISRTFFYHLGDFTEFMALTLMAIDRLIAIRLPLRYHNIVTNSRTLCITSLSWLVSIAAIGYLISVADSPVYCQPVIGYVFCSYASMVRFSCVNPEPYFNIGTIFSLFPFVAKLSNNSSRKQMINTCLSHLIVLLCFYIPKIGLMLTLAERNAFTIIASIIPPLINPTVYCFRTKEIRKRFIITGFDHLQNQKLLGVLILISYMFILLGNAVNLCIISTDRRLHKPMYILICNLAVVDVMYSSTCCTTMISVLLVEIKTVSYYSCFSRMYFYHLGDLTIGMALALMALDRIIAVRLPLRYHSIVTNSRICWMIFITWLFSFGLIGFLISVAQNLPYCQPFIRYVFCSYSSLIRAACVTDTDAYFTSSSIISLVPLGGLFPFVLCTYAVLAYSVTKLSNNANRKQMANTCLSHVIVLLSYYALKLVTILLTRIGVVLTLTERNALLIAASIVPPLINPTVYCTRTKEIRSKIADIFLVEEEWEKRNFSYLRSTGRATEEPYLRPNHSQVNDQGANASTVTEFFIVGFPGLLPKYFPLTAALFLCIYLAVLSGNSLIVLLFVIERSLHKPMYIIILSLSLSDIGFCTVALPKVISRYWFNDGYISFDACLIQRQLIHYFGTLNSLIMMIMALDRFLAICYPLRYPVLMSNRTMKLLIGFSWVTAMIAPTISLMLTLKLPFCGPNMINHCFCDSLSMNQLA